MATKRNCVQEWIRQLPTWDGIPRILTFFRVYYSSADSVYTRACGQNFWRGLVARAMEPGCQFDNVIVLEGDEGIRKSRSLRALCPWSTSLNADKIDKDFYIAIQGKLLVEIDEMNTFIGASAEAVRSAITRRDDRYRAPYDRMAKDHPRQCLFIATMNPGTDYIRDVGGGRRWWPIRCHFANVEKMEADRDQLYAEALVDYYAKKSWWELPKDEVMAEQFLRHAGDPWESYIANYIIGKYNGITINEILEKSALAMHPSMITVKEQHKSAAIMRKLNWIPKRAMRAGVQTRLWYPPGSDDERVPGSDDDKE
jgi:predicted P-loop ATPase